MWIAPRIAALAMGLALLAAAPAGATSVGLVFRDGSSTSAVDGIGTDTVGVSSVDPTTLTLDVVIDVDAAGLSSAFLSLQFDTNLADELDVLSFKALPARRKRLSVFVPVLDSQESAAGVREGRIYTFDATTMADGPANSTLAFARVVFVTHPEHLQNDGPDVFAGLFNPGVDGMFDNAGQPIDPGIVSASVIARGLALLTPSTGSHPFPAPAPPPPAAPPPQNPPRPGDVQFVSGDDYFPASGSRNPVGMQGFSIPEPATASLLGLGLAFLGLAARRPRGAH